MNKEEKDTLEYLSKTLIPDLYKRLVILENQVYKLESSKVELWDFANAINRNVVSLVEDKNDEGIDTSLFEAKEPI